MKEYKEYKEFKERGQEADVWRPPRTP